MIYNNLDLSPNDPRLLLERRGPSRLMTPAEVQRQFPELYREPVKPLVYRVGDLIGAEQLIQEIFAQRHVSRFLACYAGCVSETFDAFVQDYKAVHVYILNSQHLLADFPTGEILCHLAAEYFDAHPQALTVPGMPWEAIRERAALMRSIRTGLAADKLNHPDYYTE